MKKLKFKTTVLRLKKDLQVRYIFDAAEYYFWSQLRYEQHLAIQAAADEQDALDDLRRAWQKNFLALKE